jgi:hypothetical protein
LRFTSLSLSVFASFSEMAILLYFMCEFLLASKKNKIDELKQSGLTMEKILSAVYSGQKFKTEFFLVGKAVNPLSSATATSKKTNL